MTKNHRSGDLICPIFFPNPYSIACIRELVTKCVPAKHVVLKARPSYIPSCGTSLVMQLRPWTVANSVEAELELSPQHESPHMNRSIIMIHATTLLKTIEQMVMGLFSGAVELSLNLRKQN